MHRDNRSHLTHAGLSGCLQCGEGTIGALFATRTCLWLMLILPSTRTPQICKAACQPRHPACMCSQDYAVPEAESDICAR